MARILVFVMAGMFVLCVACVGLGYFVGLPRAQDAIEDEMEEAISTYVVPQIAGVGITPTAGTYTLSAGDVNAAIQSDNPELDDLRFAITPDQITMSFGQTGQEITYTAQVSAADGHLQVVDPQIEGVPGFVFPEDLMTDAIENAVNLYLDDTNLVLISATMGEGTLTLVTAEASG